MTVYCVYIDDTYIKSFKTLFEADICAMGIKSWFVEYGLDPDFILVRKDVLL